MEPDNNDLMYTNPQEYLDQISAKKTSRFPFVDTKILIIIIATILLVFAIIILVAVNNSSSPPSTKLLAVRLQNMEKLLEYSTNQITDSKYKKSIAETKIVFSSSNYQLSQSFDLSIDQAIASQESIEETISSLDKAAAENYLISEYTYTLVSQINLIINTLEEIEIESDSSNTIIRKAILDLSEISDRLSRN